MASDWSVIFSNTFLSFDWSNGTIVLQLILCILTVSSLYPSKERCLWSRAASEGGGGGGGGVVVVEVVLCWWRR